MGMLMTNMGFSKLFLCSLFTDLCGIEVLIFILYNIDDKSFSIEMKTLVFPFLLFLVNSLLTLTRKANKTKVT